MGQASATRIQVAICAEVLMVTCMCLNPAAHKLPCMKARLTSELSPTDGALALDCLFLCSPLQLLPRGYNNSRGYLKERFTRTHRA